MTIAIPAKDITLQPVEKGWLGTLDLVVAQRAGGRELMTPGDFVRVNPDRQRYGTLVKDSLLLHRQIQLSPVVSKIRVVVFDRGCGRSGSLEVPARSSRTAGRSRRRVGEFS
jgi:hypothetical protein